MKVVIVLAVASLVVTVAAGATDDGSSESAHYRLQPSVMSSGGQVSASASVTANGTAAQIVAVGTSSAPHFIVQSGFWGHTGSGLVPVVLTANRIAPGSVDMTWSGNNAPYDLYRAEGCASIFSSVLVTTSNNGYTDTAAPGSALTCYNVLATAPGPLSAPSP